MPTPTPFPTSIATPQIQIPSNLGSDFAVEAVQMWNTMGAIGTGIQIALLLIIILGGILLFSRAVRNV